MNCLILRSLVSRDKVELSRGVVSTSPSAHLDTPPKQHYDAAELECRVWLKSLRRNHLLAGRGRRGLGSCWGDG